MENAHAERRFLASGNKFILIISAVLLVSLNSAMALQINEVMPHSNNSLGNEWIELYNPDSSNISLSDWKIGDLSSNDTINLNISSQGFALIVDSSINCSNLSISIDSCVELANIGSGLNDGSEIVFLHDNSSALISSMSWNRSIKSSGNSWQFYSNSWQECSPTPGVLNSCPITVQNQTQGNQTTMNQTQTSTTVNYCANATIVRLLSYPSMMDFGSSAYVNVFVNSTCYNYSKIRLLAYGEGQRIIANSSDDKVTKYASCDDGTEISNSSSVMSNISLKMRAYSNCDGDYETGQHWVAIRLCYPSGDLWKEYDELEFNMSLYRNENCSAESNVTPTSNSTVQTVQTPTTSTVSNTTQTAKTVAKPKTETARTNSSKGSGQKFTIETREDRMKSLAAYLFAFTALLLVVYLAKTEFLGKHFLRFKKKVKSNA